MVWWTDVVDYLVACKRAGGHDFEMAWQEAVFRFPPDLRSVGMRNSEMTLDGLAQERSGVEWLRGVAEAAWYDHPRPESLGGGPSRLRGLQAAILDAVSEERHRPARTAGSRGGGRAVLA